MADSLQTQLKQARINKGLSQQEIGERLGLPQSHLSKIENGKTDLRVSSLIQLSGVLGLELVLVPKKHWPVVHAILNDKPTGVPRFQLDEEV